MGSLLSTSLGFDAITRDDLLELGFSPYKPISFIFGEPYAFKRELVIYKHPNLRRANKLMGVFQLIVTFPRTTKPADDKSDGNPVAVLTRKILGEGGWRLDSKNAIVELDCDLSTLKTMMDENYLRTLITVNE
jgi:hypothetical protein